MEPPPLKPSDAIARFLRFVERLGNLLPHPVTLFFLLAVGVILLSGILSWIGVSVQDPRFADRQIEVVSLFGADGLRRILENLVDNFSSFVPLGTVLVTMLGVGVAEASGLLSTAIRSIVLFAPKRLLTFAVVFAGVLSNTASEMGYVVLVPMAGFLFLAVKRHPLAGMAAAFAGVSGGYSANLLIGPIDPLLAGITQEAARFLDPEYTVHPAINWYFMMASTFVVSFIGTWVTHRFVEPTLGSYDDTYSDQGAGQAEAYLKPLTPEEKRGLVAAFGSILLLAGLAAWTIVPEGGVLRDPETGDILRSPFMSGLVAWLLVFFLIPSVVYGRITGSIRSDRDVINGMSAAMARLSLYIVLVFFAAQFVAFFRWTNLGEIMAVTGANFLIAIGLDNPLVFLPFILMCGFVNLMLGSASAQWAVTAPIFVPMLMTLGFSPEVIQAAYRIGDSTTNIITPMMSYFALILAFAARFDRRIGIGTIISTMLPYSICLLAGWIFFFYLWVFILGFPVGPGAPTYITLPGESG
jgi:aminobenzoyl-glutamate transport protein